MTLRQKSPKLFAVAESLTFAISDLFDESGQLLAALYPAPVDPDDIAVQNGAFPVRQPAHCKAKIPTRRLRIAYIFGKWKIR